MCFLNPGGAQGANPGLRNVPRVGPAVSCTARLSWVAAPAIQDPIPAHFKRSRTFMHQVFLVLQIATEVSLTYVISPRNSHPFPPCLQSLRPSLECPCRNEQSP
jgi:hypothetical protein